MPLRKSSSRKAWVANFTTERRAGKPRKQAAAIAYAVQRRARKKAR